MVGGGHCSGTNGCGCGTPANNSSCCQSSGACSHSLSKRMGAQFFLDKNNPKSNDSKSSVRSSSRSRSTKGATSDTKFKLNQKSTPTTRLGDQYGGGVDFKTRVLIEDSGITESLLEMGGPVCSDKKPSILKNANESMGGEDELVRVAVQLKEIQETQDAILESLRNDIELIQTENIVLRQNNNRLQGEISQMSQLVSDLSFDLRKMRDCITTDQSGYRMTDKNHNRKSTGRTQEKRDKLSKSDEYPNSAQTKKAPSTAKMSTSRDGGNSGAIPRLGKPKEERAERKPSKIREYSKVRVGVDTSYEPAICPSSKSNNCRTRTASCGSNNRQRSATPEVARRRRGGWCFGGLCRGKKNKRKNEYRDETEDEAQEEWKQR